jgi:hypothetical protein
MKSASVTPSTRTKAPNGVSREASVLGPASWAASRCRWNEAQTWHPGFGSLFAGARNRLDLQVRGLLAIVMGSGGSVGGQPNFAPSDFRSWVISRRAAYVVQMAANDPKRTHCPPVAAEGHIRCVVWRFG